MLLLGERHARETAHLQRREKEQAKARGRATVSPHFIPCRHDTPPHSPEVSPHTSTPDTQAATSGTIPKSATSPWKRADQLHRAPGSPLRGVPLSQQCR